MAGLQLLHYTKSIESTETDNHYDLIYSGTKRSLHYRRHLKIANTSLLRNLMILLEAKHGESVDTQSIFVRRLAYPINQTTSAYTPTPPPLLPYSSSVNLHLRSQKLLTMPALPTRMSLAADAAVKPVHSQCECSRTDHPLNGEDTVEDEEAEIHCCDLWEIDAEYLVGYSDSYLCGSVGAGNRCFFLDQKVIKERGL